MTIPASIIIPVYNGEATIENCILSLLNQSMPADTYEIIVVDDGSTDSTGDVVGKFAGSKNLKYIHQKNSGPSAARNCGVEAASGEIVLFIDADCEASFNWIEEMLRPFKDAGVAGVKGVYTSRQKEIIARLVQLEYEDKYNRMKRFPSIDFIDTYACGYRRKVFRQAGGFDNSFPTASVEDQEFSFRIAKKGHKLVFNPKASVRHLHAASLGNYLRKKYKIGYWKVLVLKKHPEKMVSDSHTPQLLKFQMVLAPVVIISGLYKFVCGGRLFFELSLLSYLLTSTPFILFSSGKDIVVSIISPAVFYLRSLALLSGMIKGFFILGKQ
ncbi:MAG: glycosyltransferase [Nitrospiraceae bacterium]|nr:MAG: glycosyltransferase [Nitrospiraceae bacterium]